MSCNLVGASVTTVKLIPGSRSPTMQKRNKGQDNANAATSQKVMSMTKKLRRLRR